MENIQTHEGEGVNQAGSPEHINEMLAKVDNPIQTSDAGEVKQDGMPTLEGRPEWLPEKFDSPEALSRAYSELERSFHQNNQEESVEGFEESANLEQEAIDIQNTTAPQVHQLLDERGLDFAVFQEEYNSTGELSKDAYEALDEAGISGDMVNSWIAGQEAVANQTIDSIYEIVGGKEQYDQMIEWADDNLEPWEVESFNTQIENLDPNSQFAVTGLQARYQNSIGAQSPHLVYGESAQHTMPKFESLNELTRAMSDKRYAEDPHFRSEVAKRLNNSAIL